MVKGFLASAFLPSGFLTEGEAPLVFVDGSGLIVTSRRKRRIERPRDLDRLPEDIAREQRMLEEYVEALEARDHKAIPPAAAKPIAVKPAAIEPRLTDAMARAASDTQLAAIMRSASAAELDRQRAVEEEYRRDQQRRRTLLLLLALD